MRLEIFSQLGVKVWKWAHIQIMEIEFIYFNPDPSIIHRSIAIPFLITFLIQFNYKMDNQEEKEQMTNEEALQKLNLIIKQLDETPQDLQSLFRAYVSIYVQKHSLSQDFFTYFCEHAIISRLFNASTHQCPSMAVLEIFNLLLANTSQLNSLVFIFSQPCLHLYLFERFNPNKQTGQTVQYYIQLLKTIILKISCHGNNSLIKLFCNNRYPSFPLLTAVTGLASSWELQSLVRVTAQQCVLQLINLINDKKVGRGYLSDLQMVIFYHELTVNLRQNKFDHEGLHYLVDLIFAVHQNSISLSFLLNALVNNVVLFWIEDLGKVLQFVNRLTLHMEEYIGFPTKIYAQIKLILLNILNNIYFSTFLNSTYLTALKLMPSLKTSKQPNLQKYYLQRGEKVSAYLLEFDNRPQSQEEKLLVFDGWANFNCSSEEVQKIKDSKPKGKISFLNFFYSKPDQIEQYVRIAVTSVGLNYEQMKFPLYKLSVSLNFKTSLYLVEQILTKRWKHINKDDHFFKIQEYEAHFNDMKGKFDLKQFLGREVIKMTHKLSQYNIQISKEYQILKPEIQLEYCFLVKLRSYIATNLSDYILDAQKNVEIQELAVISVMLQKLNINERLDRKGCQKLLWKLQQVQSDINDLTFANDFKGLISYIIQNKYQRYISHYQDESFTPIYLPIKTRVELKVFQYQCIRRILYPTSQSLGSFVNKQWNKILLEQELHLQYNHFDSFKAPISVYTDPSGFKIKLMVEKIKQISFKIHQQDGNIDEEDNTLLLFKEYPAGIRMSCKKEAEHFCSNISFMRSKREECFTKLIVRYFETTYNLLRDRVHHMR